MSITTERAAARAQGVEVDPNQCPGCGLNGVTPERVRETTPDYMKELDALPPMGTPSEPRELCWDCRALHKASDGPWGRQLREEF